MVTPTTSYIESPLVYATMDTKGMENSTSSDATPWVIAFATSSPNVSFSDRVFNCIASF
jgi:hypothetical protein